MVFETVGDAVYAAFARPADAVAAALAGQLALQGEDWGELGAGALRARMGLHTGEVEVQGAHYFGRAAVPLRAAHGHGPRRAGGALRRHGRAGPRRAAGGRGACATSGEHRLKDLPRPERVFQLLHPALPARLPAPAHARRAGRHNLPVPADPPRRAGAGAGGRRAGRLLRPDVRLLTLTGPGGRGQDPPGPAGRRRRCCDDFPDGAAFAGLGVAPAGCATAPASCRSRRAGPRAAGGPAGSPLGRPLARPPPAPGAAAGAGQLRARPGRRAPDVADAAGGVPGPEGAGDQPRRCCGSPPSSEWPGAPAGPPRPGRAAAARAALGACCARTPWPCSSSGRGRCAGLRR